MKLAEVEERIFGGDCKGWLHAQVVLWKWTSTHHFVENSAYLLLKIELLLTVLSEGPYIKYVGEGWAGQMVFVGAMKYFRHILMGHEIFFKIFDEPRNIFVCSIFIILFFKLKGLKHKISKLAIKEI